MKRFLITIAVALFAALSAPVYAGGISSNAVNGAGFDDLTEAQKAEVLKTIADKVAASKVAPTVIEAVSTPKKVGEWLDVGTKIGQMMGGAAKELGIAVNDFVKTPVGQWTMAIIIWKFMGGALVHVFGGLLLLAVCLTVIWLVARTQREVDITYDAEKKDIFGRAVVKRVVKSKLTDDDTAWILVCTAVSVIMALFTIFSF
jgi:hypothetical protein